MLTEMESNRRSDASGFDFDLLRSKWHLHLSASHYHSRSSTGHHHHHNFSADDGEGNGWCLHPFPKPGMYFIGNNICMRQFNCTDIDTGHRLCCLAVNSDALASSVVVIGLVVWTQLKQQHGQVQEVISADYDFTKVVLPRRP